MTISEKNKEIKLQNQKQLRELETSLVNATIDNLDKLIEEKRTELTSKILSLKEEHLALSPLVISSYFFKSISPLNNVQPKYNAEKLGIVWELYEEMICEININVRSFMPSISNFCKFAGITTNTFRSYKSSSDDMMRTVIEKIEDFCYDSNVTSAQNGLLKERMTVYRMKSEQGVTEQTSAQVVEHKHEFVDPADSLKRLNEIKKFNNNRIIECEYNEK